MTTFIAGGTGFVGRRLVPLLAHAAKRSSAWISTRRRLVSEFGVHYRPYRERVLQIINDIRKEEGLPEVAPR